VEQQLGGRWIAPFETQSFGYRIETEYSGRRRGLATSAVSQRAQGSLLVVVGAYADPAEAITGEQRQFLNQCAPPDVQIDRLVALGPIDSTRWTNVPIGGLKVNVESWTAADLDIVELSIQNTEPR
jgi:hypothetical protein